MKKAFCIIGLLILALGDCTAQTRVDDTIFDETVAPVHVESMTYYPGLAHMARQEGVVVVRVRLNEKGEVTSATAISGPKLLIDSCEKNARKWVFKPNPQAAAVIVYNFVIDENLCPTPDAACPVQFTFRKPNFATIIKGKPWVFLD